MSGAGERFRWLWPLAMGLYGVLAAVLLFTGGPPAEVGKGVNLVPFHTIQHTIDAGNSQARIFLVGNLALLAPLGASLLLWRRVTRHRIAVAVLVSVPIAIETLQFLLPGARSVDIDDFILNSIGGLAAYASCALWRGWLRRRDVLVSVA